MQKRNRILPRCRIYKPTICSGLGNKYITIYIAIISIISFFRCFFTQIQLGKMAFIIAQKPFLKGLLYINYTITGLVLLADGRFHSIVNEKKAKTDAQKRAIAKWEDKFKQRIIRLTPEKDAALVKCTEENGESVNAMLNRLVDKEIEKKLK